jgi:anti-sigma factor RsiW
MSRRREISDDDLHAFIDGALDSARTAQVEAAIQADPALAERIAAFVDDKAMLKRIYQPVAERPLPARWVAMARGAKPDAPRNWRLAGAIAATLLMALAATGLWLRPQPQKPGGIVEAALTAREQTVADERIISVAADADARRYDAELKTAVAMNIKVPDLGKMGYRLTGLHLYARAAELLYRDGQGRLFTLYLRRSDGAARFDQFQAHGLRVCVWQDEELGTVMAGNVSTAAMQRLASLAYTGLTL